MWAIEPEGIAISLSVKGKPGMLKLSSTSHLKQGREALVCQRKGQWRGDGLSEAKTAPESQWTE